MPEFAQLQISYLAGPDLGLPRWGGLRQFLVPPCLYACPESRRPDGHERLWPLDVRAVVLAAGDPAAWTDRQSVLWIRNSATWISTSTHLAVCTDPFCEPSQIPGTPNISVGMEQFNDTPIVNGTAYPTVTLQPKSYRLRILNAANDRFLTCRCMWPTPERQH